MKKWKAANGNICFEIPMNKLFTRPWVIIFTFLISIGICCITSFVWDNYVILTSIIIVLSILFLWLTNRQVVENKTFIEKSVHEIMDNIVKRDASKIGATIVRSLVHHDIKGTYGKVEASCLLVLLDNEEVWEYPLIYHNSNKLEVYLECDRNHIICKTPKHIKKINPKRWARFLGLLKLSEKTILRLLLMTILLLGGITVIGSYYLFEHINIVRFTLLFIGYLAMFSIIESLYIKWPCKFLNLIRTLNSIPFAILYIIFHIGIPFLTMLGTYLFVTLIAFVIPAAILITFSNQNWLVLKMETIAFIVFSIGSIICSHSYQTTKCIIHFTPLHDQGNHTYESYREQLAIYLIHPSNVIFLLYLVYFIFLIISGFLQIEKESYVISQEFDTAIIKAFLVFIAFTNMRAKAKDAELDTKELFIKTIKLFAKDE